MGSVSTTVLDLYLSRGHVMAEEGGVFGCLLPACLLSCWLLVLVMLKF